MNTSITAYLNRYISITESENRLFQSFLTKKFLKKKEFLQKEGTISQHRFFIVKGCLRMFYIDSKGSEQIIHFGLDGWWIAEYDSLINNTPSNICIQALEDTELLVLDQAGFEILCLELPIVNSLFRIIMEKTYVAAQRRIQYMLSYSGEELFKNFTSHNPEFLQRVPQYMIASYLGMTPEFYSKMRGHIK